MHPTIYPWLAAAVALGIGVLLVGNSPWLCAFVFPVLILGFVVIWP